jgi:ribosomal protein S18 acetylase RimI-like enzyme
VAADARAVATVHVGSWQAGYRGVVDDAILDGLSVDRRERAWQGRLAAPGAQEWTFVAERDGAVVGFCSVAAPTRDRRAADATAEITALYVDPDHWRSGAGTALLDAARDALRADGWARVTLWVLEDNASGRAFYERCGFVADGARQELPELGVFEVRMVREPL